MKAQERIGLVFGGFSLVLFALKIIIYITAIGNLNGFCNIDRMSYLLYAMVFACTVYWKHISARIIQVAIVILEGFLAIQYQDDMLAGFILLVTSIYLLVIYGFFLKNRKLKIASINILIYIALAIYIYKNNVVPWVTALEWILLIDGFIFLSWVTFKDYIDKLKKENQELIAISADLVDIGKEAINLEKSINKGN